MLQHSSWGDLGYKVIGEKGTDKGEGLKNLFKTFKYKIQDDGNHFWAIAPEHDNYSPEKTEKKKFINLEFIFSSDNISKASEVIKGNKYSTTKGTYVPKSELEKILEDIWHSSESLASKFNSCSNLLFFAEDSQLPDIFQEVCKWFLDFDKNLKIYYLTYNPSFEEKTALINFANNIDLYGSSTIQEYYKTTGIVPRRPLSNLSDFLNHPGVLFNILGGLFFPNLYFYPINLFGSFLIIQLTKPINITDDQKRTFLSRLKESAVFRENTNLDIKKLIQDPLNTPIPSNRFLFPQFTSSDLENFFIWYVNAINKIADDIFNPLSFSDNYKININQIYYYHQSIARIIGETNLILNTLEPDIRKILFFELLDKYSAVISFNKKGAMKQEKCFKELLKRSNFENKIVPTFSSMPEIFKNYFQNIAISFFDSILNHFWENVTAKWLIKGDEIEILTKSLKRPGTFVNKEDYVANLLRTIRNSHHSYLDDSSKRNERYLSTNLCSIPSLIPNLSEIFFLSLISNYEAFKKGDWI